MLEMRARNATATKCMPENLTIPNSRSFNQHRYPLLTTFWFQTALSC